MAKVAGLPACATDTTKVQNQRVAKLQIVFIFFFYLFFLARRGPNDKPSSNAVLSMAAKDNEATLCIMTELLSWPCEDSQFCYPLMS